MFPCGTFVKSPRNIGVLRPNAGCSIMEHMSNDILGAWVKKAVGPASQNEIHRRTGIAKATLHRQYPDELSPQNIVAIARAFDVSPISGLVASGLISSADLADYDAREALALASDELLVQEIARRLENNAGGHSALTSDSPFPYTPSVVDQPFAADHDHSIEETIDPELI